MKNNIYIISFFFLLPCRYLMVSFLPFSHRSFFSSRIALFLAAHTITRHLRGRGSLQLITWPERKSYLLQLRLPTMMQLPMRSALRTIVVRTIRTHPTNTIRLERGIGRATLLERNALQTLCAERDGTLKTGVFARKWPPRGQGIVYPTDARTDIITLIFWRTVERGS